MMCSTLAKSSKAYVDEQTSIPAPERDLLARQMGQILVEIGVMFNAAPINEHVDRNTADLLISIGNKLKRKG